MPAAQLPALDPATYLKQERKATEKSEYLNGHVYAMAGASREHNQLVFNLAGLLHAQLRGSPCSAFVNDMRVRSDTTESYFYPDLTVVCSDAEFEDDEMDTLLNPVLIIEVLSPSTEGYDRGAKFAHYRRIESLHEYVLITQDRYSIERYVRNDGGLWTLSEVSTLDAAIELTTIGCRLQLNEVYEKVSMPL
ncbi:MAG: hypothetical protein CSA50_01800 [Gammaproteobacteria bacterium]|nr:MAG: hypothetical protein CSA50_01800 [Gammaproteobacteria bacterium]